MSDPNWSAVDLWLGEKLIDGEESFQFILEANAAAGLPAIDLSPTQAKLLHLLVRLAGARRVLEVGTLGGYSTAWLASALPEGGQVVTLEIDPRCADVAHANLEEAGLADRVEILVGPALNTLGRMIEEDAEPFHFVFLDADKENNAHYLRLALQLSRPGATIVCDNVVRQGQVIDQGSDDPATKGTRALFDELSGNKRLTGTAIQTVGVKGWDGFAMAIVEEAR